MNTVYMVSHKLEFHFLFDIQDENQKLRTPLMRDRNLMQRRAFKAMDTFKATGLVNKDQIAAIGFCFGGLVVLDMARTGDSSLLGVASFHGILDAPVLENNPDISTKVRHFIGMHSIAVDFLLHVLHRSSDAPWFVIPHWSLGARLPWR